MLKRIPVLALSLWMATMLTQTTSAQDLSTAEEVIKAHIEATGGQSAWQSVKDMYSEIEVVAATPMGDLTIEMKSWSIFPGYGYTEMGLLDGPDGIPAEAVSMKAYYTPLEGWIEQGGQRQDMNALPPEAKQQFMRASAKTELSLLDGETELTLKESTTFNDRDVYVVGATQFGMDTEIWVDQETLMIVAQKAAGSTTEMGGYQEIDGLLFSMGQVAETAQGKQSVTIRKVELNSGLTPSQLAAKSGARKQAVPE